MPVHQLALRVNDDGTFTDSTPFVVDESGNVGIGTTSPISLLDLSSATGAIQTLKRDDTSVTANDLIGQFDFRAADTSTTTNFVAASIRGYATNTISTDINPGYLSFYTTPTNVAATPIERMRIAETGITSFIQETSGSIGSELVTNVTDRDFSASSGNWTGANWTIGSGVATHTAGAADEFVHTLAATAGSTYQIIATVNTTTAELSIPKWGMYLELR